MFLLLLVLERGRSEKQRIVRMLEFGIDHQSLDDSSWYIDYIYTNTKSIQEAGRAKI